MIHPSPTIVPLSGSPILPTQKSQKNKILNPLIYSATHHVNTAPMFTYAVETIKPIQSIHTYKTKSQNFRNLRTILLQENPMPVLPTSRLIYHPANREFPYQHPSPSSPKKRKWSENETKSPFTSRVYQENESSSHRQQFPQKPPTPRPSLRRRKIQRPRPSFHGKKIQ